jgi:formate--tetrahydrofolate ligase
VTATRAALAFADIVVTEAGFAFELGAEKFFDINCRYGGFAPACTVLVATIRALKMHGGKPLAEVGQTDVAAMVKGLSNLEKHVENIRKFGQPCVVAINHFPTDCADEVAALQRHCESLRVRAVLARPFSEGGPGCIELAEVVRDLAARSEPQFKPLYEWDEPIEQKIATVAREMYGAQAVDYTKRGLRDREQLERLGFGKLPICIAKTQQSLSDNPALLGRPKDFLVTVREIQLAAGAGFVIPITGEIMRMPGLPREPMAHRFDLTDDGEMIFRAN